MNTKPILLVDDSEDDIMFTRMALAKSNLANPVDVCINGVDALEYLRREGPYAGRAAQNPCVVMLDVKMPKMNGLELLKIMREDPALTDIPVVMLTSSRSDRDILESYKHRANAFVVKPVDPTEFFEAVTQIGLFWALRNESPPETA